LLTNENKGRHSHEFGLAVVCGQAISLQDVVFARLFVSLCRLLLNGVHFVQDFVREFVVSCFCVPPYALFALGGSVTSEFGALSHGSPSHAPKPQILI
jgi:hypothetical protein